MHLNLFKKKSFNRNFHVLLKQKFVENSDLWNYKSNRRHLLFQVVAMSKRSNDNRPIEEILKEFVETNNLQNGLDKVNVREAWTNLMGNGVNNYTSAIELKHDTLYVQLSSSVLREELSYGNEKIVKMLNESLGKEIVKKLVLR